jgi:hypothetical protein
MPDLERHLQEETLMMKMMVASPHYCPKNGLIQVMTRVMIVEYPSWSNFTFTPFKDREARSNQTIYQNYRI